jgi:hypothetical protein
MSPRWTRQVELSRTASLALFSAALQRLRHENDRGRLGLTTRELYDALLVWSASGYWQARTLFSERDVAIALARHQQEANGGWLTCQGHGRHARWSWREDPQRYPAAPAVRQPRQQRGRQPSPIPQPRRTSPARLPQQPTGRAGGCQR